MNPGALLALLVAAAPPSADSPAASRSEPASWLLLSDLHFNPLASPAALPDLVAHPAREWRAILEKTPGAPSSYGVDSNYPLLASALKEMRRRLPSPPVVLIAGDLLQHHFREQFEGTAPRGADFEGFAEKTVEFLALELNATFPRAQFILALGNNDSTAGDYVVVPNDGFLTHLAASWEPLVNREGRAPGFRAGFSGGGLYVVKLPLPGSPEAVVLDSVLWSAHAASGAAPGKAELESLRSALDTAVPWRWVVAHVPPGFDAFTSAKRGEPVGFLDPESTAQLVQALSSPKARTAEVITGHSHHAAFELLSGGDGKPGRPLVSLPSLSPIFRNNPAFTTASVDVTTGSITATETYVLPLDQADGGWSQESSCRRGPDDAPSLASYQAELVEPGAKAAATYLGCFSTQSQVGAVPEKDWPWYLCADANQTREAYCACLAKLHAAHGCR